MTAGGAADPLRVLYAEAVYGDEEIDAVLEVLRTSPHALMNGPKVAAFEREVARRFGTRRGVMVNSGSSANLLALASLDLEPGSEVITPALTFATTVSPIVQLGLRPAFVDCLPDSYVVDPAGVESMISERTRALMIPNLIGNIAPLDQLQKIAEKHDLALVEDSADTIGGTLHGRPTGSFADVTTTSFYASHIVTGAGSGGMVCLSDPERGDRVTLLRGWGRNASVLGETEDARTRFAVSVDGMRYDAKFLFTAMGYNFLPSEISAAFGLVQLERLDENIARRAYNFGRLSEFFGGYEFISTPQPTDGADAPWLAFPLVVAEDAPFDRTDLQVHFESDGIQTRTVFTGNILRQPGFVGIDHRAAPDGYPESDRVMRGGLLVGCHQGLTESHLERIEGSFRQFVTRSRA